MADIHEALGWTKVPTGYTKQTPAGEARLFGRFHTDAYFRGWSATLGNLLLGEGLNTFEEAATLVDLAVAKAALDKMAREQVKADEDKATAEFHKQLSAHPDYELERRRAEARATHFAQMERVAEQSAALAKRAEQARLSAWMDEGCPL